MRHLEPEHQHHIYVGEPDEDLIESLEPDQLVQAVGIPLPRRTLGRGASAGLWGLRILMLAMAAMVVYVFVVGALQGG